MDDIARQLAARDRLRRALALRKTPEERLRDMAELQEATWRLLRQSAEGYAHFLRRNFKARAIPVPGSVPAGAVGQRPDASATRL